MKNMLRFFVFGVCAVSLCGQIEAAEDSQVTLDPITVIQSAVRAPFVYRVSGNRIAEVSPDSFLDFLNSLPIDIQSRSEHGGIQSDFSMRGTNYQGVLMLLDGKRINDPQTGHHNSDIPFTLADFSTIDLLPGVSSAIYGPDGIGGAVDFSIRKPERNLFLFEARGGQFGTWGDLLSIERSGTSGGFRFSAENRESQGFRYDTDYKKRTVSASGSTHIHDADLYCNFGYQNKEFGAYDFYTPGRNFPSREWTETYLLETGADIAVGTGSLKPSLLWRRHYDRFLLDETGIYSTFRSRHRTDMYTPALSFSNQSSLLGSYQAGLEWGFEDINSSTLYEHDRTHYGFSFHTEKEAGEHIGIGGSYRFDSYSTFGNSSSGSLHVRFTPVNEHSFDVGVVRSVRIPTFTELYYNDPTTAGNDTLVLESALTSQLSYSLKKDTYSLGATVFYRWENNCIDWVKDNFAQPKWQAMNINTSDVFGLEGFGRIIFSKYMRVYSTYAYTNKVVNDSGILYKYGPNYARHLVHAQVDFTLPFGTQSVGLTYKNKPGRDGWVIADIRLAYDVNAHAQVFAEAANFGDCDYEEIAGIPSPGRWMQAGLRFEW